MIQNGVRFFNGTARKILPRHYHLYVLDLADITSVYPAIVGMKMVFGLDTREYDNLCEAYVTAEDEILRTNLGFGTSHRAKQVVSGIIFGSDSSSMRPGVPNSWVSAIVTRLLSRI
jgi:hypothetical protein